MKVLISATPFGKTSNLPFDLLKKNNLDFNIRNLENISNNKFAQLIKDVDILIAGLEKLDSRKLGYANKLKLISRVGIGLDNIDINYAIKNKIKISYTPDAVTHSVAEYTFALSHSLNRKIHESNILMHDGKWARLIGRKFIDLNFGIIGFGRIGSEFAKKLRNYGVKKIYINDLKKIKKKKYYKISSKKEIYKNCDVISMHVPLNKKNLDLITINEIKLMKQIPILINTSRGGIINENDLYFALKNNLLSSAAIDVFKNEPYFGKLKKLTNCLLTCHMGAMTDETRKKMELEATEEAISFFKNKPLKREIKYNEEKK
jgi:D-3-phosphoglycerate dehydrogenase